MKILCLHGYRNSKDNFEKSIQKNVIKKLKSHQFYFLNSLFVHPEEGYQWWATTKEGLYNLKSYDTIKESIDYIIQYIKQNQIDVIWGFSQGGCLANIIVHLYPDLVKKIIISSGFPCTDLEFKVKVETKISVECLITFGTKDDLVVPELTKQLSNFYFQPDLYEHKWGHVIPNDNSFTTKLDTFLGK